jgi:hypothetical protein
MLSLIVASMLSVLWLVPLLLLSICGLQVRLISSQTQVLKANKTFAKGFASVKWDDMCSGLICGRWYLGYIMVSENTSQQGTTTSYKVYLLSSLAFFKTLTILDEVDDCDEYVDLYEKESLCYFENGYSKRAYNVTRFCTRHNQACVVNEILSVYHTKKQAVCFLSGEPGCGKSMIGALLAKHFMSSICDQFNPTNPGTLFSKLWLTVSPTFEKPLIVVLDEIDAIIGKIHHQSIRQNDFNGVMCHDKQTWNGFLDSIDRKLYPNTIFLMTSNKSITFLNELDSSYLRYGRVDLKLTLQPP